MEASAEKERGLVAQVNALAGQVDPYKLEVANALWGEKTCPFETSFQETLAKYYGAEDIVEE